MTIRGMVVEQNGSQKLSTAVNDSFLDFGHFIRKKSIP